jgi:predicted phage tail protein
MRVIRLNGELGRRFGRVHKLDVRTPAEAIRALCANFDGFEQFVANSHKHNVAYRCVVDRDPLDEAQIGYPMSKSFSITPVVHGGGKVLGVILGAVLLVAAIALTPVTGGASLAAAMQATPALLGLTMANVAWLGAALVLGGIASLLAPTPMAQQQGRTNENQYFNGPVNTTLQGGVVPIGYGRAIVGSAVISAAITVEQKGTPQFTYDIPFTGFAKQ